MGICLRASLDGSYRGSRIPAGPVDSGNFSALHRHHFTYGGLNLLAYSLALYTSKTTHYLTQTVKRGPSPQTDTGSLKPS